MAVSHMCRNSVWLVYIGRTGERPYAPCSLLTRAVERQAASLAELNPLGRIFPFPFKW